VATPDELRAVISKILDHTGNLGDSPGQTRALLLSDDSQLDRKRNGALAAELRQGGLVASELLAEAPTGSDPAAELRNALDGGAALVHFYGHGGRYMWQLGNPALPGAKDLFRIEDLEQLRPRTDWPLVLSMTCSSGPFDHPKVDSLAERLLTLPDKGAAAVLASSARNAPPPRFSRFIIEHLVQGETIGEAVMQAKRAIPSQAIHQNYNLLGDPALLLRNPTGAK
jgi:hypothetical protein